MRSFVLSRAQQRRLEELSRDAGRSPAETFRYVLRDGFEFCEWEVRESLAADYDGMRKLAEKTTGDSGQNEKDQHRSSGDRCDDGHAAS